MVDPGDVAPPPPRRALCPLCGSGRLSITTSIVARYEVGRDGAGELAVLRERLDDADWGGDDPATCDGCGWTGAVGDVRFGTPSS